MTWGTGIPAHNFIRSPESSDRLLSFSFARKVLIRTKSDPVTVNQNHTAGQSSSFAESGKSIDLIEFDFAQAGARELPVTGIDQISGFKICRAQK